MSYRMVETATEQKSATGGASRNATNAAHGPRSALFAVAFAFMALGAGPVACFSDVVDSACRPTEPCAADADGDATGGGAAGVANGGSGAGGSGAGVSFAANAGSGGAARPSEVGASGEGGEGGAPVCEGCEISPSTLPAPCGGRAYAATLSIEGGLPPYEWHISPPVAGWQIGADPETLNGLRAKLTGNPTAATSVNVVVVDAAGELTKASYSLVPRISCWFAYTALETAGPELRLRDPVLDLPPPLTLTHNRGVYDFLFSPDGQFLAYRFGADAAHPNGKQLALIDLSAWTEQVLGEDADTVTAYAWSGDSSVLAVAFTSAGVGYLGGAKLSTSATPTTLEATPTSVDASLAWIDPQHVAFPSTLLPDYAKPGQFLPNPGNLRTPFSAALGASGFAPPVAFTALGPYAPGAVLRPAGRGFFTISPDDADVTFNWLTSVGATSAEQDGNFVSPSGNYSAGITDDQLQIFKATDGVFSPALAESDPDDPDGGCPKLLTWAKAQERIACVANATNGASGASHGEVRIFDLQQPGTLTKSVLGGYCVKDAGSTTHACGALEYDYTEEGAAAEARAFSASGNWFAFATGTTDASGPGYLYWADLRVRPFTLKRKVLYDVLGATAKSPTALAFSPDERFLLLQRGNVLSAHQLDVNQNDSMGAASPIYVSRTLPAGTSQATSPCSEDFVSAPDRWCGNADRAVPFAWSPDPRFLAYRTDGKLTVEDITSLESKPYPAAECGEQCSSQFLFQPVPH